MKKTIFMILAVVIVFASAVSAQTTFIINPYPPFSFMEGQTARGLSVDILKAVSEEIGVELKMEYYEWEEAYDRLKNEEALAMPTILMNRERKEMFKLAGPVSIVKTSLFSHDNVDFGINNLEDAKRVNKICVVRDYYSETALRNEGFENLVVYDSQREAFDAFMKNEDCLIAANNFSLVTLLDEDTTPSVELNVEFTFSIDLMYMAFSDDVEQSTVDKWQKGLDQIKENGTFEKIYQKWIPWGTPPGKQVFLCEDYPPLTYENSEGQATGFVTDIVREINKRMGNREPIMVLDWDMAYEAAVLNPNVVLFSIARTEERDPLFNWVGPVIQTEAYLYKNAESNRAVPSIEYAKKVKQIATTSSWWMEQRLRELGFENLVSYPNPEECVRKLIEGDVELSIFTDITVKGIVENAGYDMNQLEKALFFEARDVYIAISKGSEEDFIDQFEQTLETLIEDGTYLAIENRYF